MRGLLLLGLFLLACTTAPQRPEGPPATPLKLKDAYDRPVQFDPGKEATLLVFWSCTWDPHAVTVWKTLKGLKGPRIVVVAYDEQAGPLKKFLKAHPADFPVALGNVQAYDSYAIDSLPTLVLVDERGSIVLRTVGVPDPIQLQSELEKYLGSGN